MHLAAITLLAFAAQAAPAPEDYYKPIEDACRAQSDPSCCLVSVKALRNGGYRLADEKAPKSPCPEGSSVGTLNCIDSYRWCVPFAKASADCSKTALDAMPFLETESRVVGKVAKTVCSPAKGYGSCRTTLTVTQVLSGCLPRGRKLILRHTRGEPPADDTSGGSFRFDGFKKGTSWEFSQCYWTAGADWAACDPVPDFKKAEKAATSGKAAAGR